ERPRDVHGLDRARPPQDPRLTVPLSGPGEAPDDERHDPAVPQVLRLARRVDAQHDVEPAAVCPHRELAPDQPGERGTGEAGHVYRLAARKAERLGVVARDE